MPGWGSGARRQLLAGRVVYPVVVVPGQGGPETPATSRLALVVPVGPARRSRLWHSDRWLSRQPTASDAPHLHPTARRLRLRWASGARPICRPGSGAGAWARASSRSPILSTRSCCRRTYRRSRPRAVKIDVEDSVDTVDGLGGRGRPGRRDAGADTLKSKEAADMLFDPNWKHSISQRWNSSQLGCVRDRRTGPTTGRMVSIV